MQRKQLVLKVSTFFYYLLWHHFKAMCHFSPAGIWGNRTLNTSFSQEARNKVTIALPSVWGLHSSAKATSCVPRIKVTLIIYCGLEGLRTSRPNLSLHPRDPAVAKRPRGAFTAVFPDSCSRLPILRGSWISGISSPKSHRSVFGQARIHLRLLWWKRRQSCCTQGSDVTKLNRHVAGRF